MALGMSLSQPHLQYEIILNSTGIFTKIRYVCEKERENNSGAGNEMVCVW